MLSRYDIRGGSAGDVGPERLATAEEGRPAQVKGEFGRNRAAATPILGQIDSKRASVTSRPPRQADAPAVLDQAMAQIDPLRARNHLHEIVARSAPEILDVSPKRRASRFTWVSTTIPAAIPNAVPRTTFAVFRPTPASAVRASRSRGMIPPWSDRPFGWPSPAGSETSRGRTRSNGSGLRDRPGSAARQAGGIGKPAEQLGRHHVHTGIRALRRQDRRDQELIGIRMHESAHVASG